MKPVVVIFSGGPDSTAAAVWAAREGYDVELLTFQYRGTPQYGEIHAAMNAAKALGMKHTIVDFKSPMHCFPSPIRIMMHAGTRTGMSGEAKPHRLPFGAGMFLSVAGAYASYYKKYEMIWGATKDDAGSGRADYTAAFASSIAKSISMCTPEPFSIRTPFEKKHKFEVTKSFEGAPDLFAHTWSCSEEVPVQCGTCPACAARRISADLAGIEDRTIYSSMEFKNPFTEEQRRNPASIPEADLSKDMKCNDPDN